MISPTSLLPDDDDVMPDVKRAAQFIGTHLDDTMTIGDVAAAAGVAHRTLYKHFHDERGISPMRYARDCRFAQVREALLRAGPQDCVTTIAVQWGFCHLGRFSVEYRKRYGESPSETLRRRLKIRTAGVPPAS
jgi:transcriptional regulator GlxA family with amidase domain